MEAIGLSPETQIARASHGLYIVDDSLLTWQRIKIADNQVSWSQPEPVPANRLEPLKKHYRGNILPWERVMLDLHSGRIFCKAGPWVMDTAAVLLIALALSGP